MQGVPVDIFDMARIDTEMAHAMLQAVARAISGM